MFMLLSLHICLVVCFLLQASESCVTTALEALGHHLNHLVASDYLNRNTKVAAAALSSRD